MARTKEPVRLRQRRTKTGTRSLYLDIYFEGVRKYEYLHLYLIPEKTRADKAANAETMKLAETVLAKRIVEFRNGQFGFTNQAENVMFFPFAEAFVKESNITEGTAGCYYGTLRHLRVYAKNDRLTMRQIDKAWCQGFKRYLEGSETIHSDKTKAHMMGRFRTFLNAAVREGIIPSNPASGVRNFKMPESTREYLTIEELKAMIGTEFPKEGVRAPFLFSCFTGLRYSDVKALDWKDVSKNGDYTRITFRQQKTRSQEYMDINEQAAELMGERPEKGGKVFPNMAKPGMMRQNVPLWAKKAGVNKHITFHCARHTFATMMLTLGNDLYTVSKLLGHADISTTQIYAKVIDKNKQEAVDKIPRLL